MASKNFADASFFIEEGQVPEIHVEPHSYTDGNDKKYVNARIEIQSSDEDEFTLELSLPIPALKGLIVAAQKFLNKPGNPDPKMVPGAGGCYPGLTNMN